MRYGGSKSVHILLMTMRTGSWIGGQEIDHTFEARNRDTGWLLRVPSIVLAQSRVSSLPPHLSNFDKEKT